MVIWLATFACSTPEPECAGDADGDGFSASAPSCPDLAAGDCDDADPAVSPRGVEIPADGVDQNCDRVEPCFVDSDGDGHGAGLGVGTVGCRGANEASVDDDCDDSVAATFPGAIEAPADGRDDDCDGGEACWRDADDDDHTPGTLVPSVDLDCDDAGETWSAALDCDDDDPTVHADAADAVGDAVDSDCDGWIFCWVDADGDGYGGPGVVAATGCDGVDLASITGDCDDADPDVVPFGLERCNLVDDDCDGFADDADPDDIPADVTWWYADADGDGFGDSSRGTLACVGAAGSASAGGDCSDTRVASYPGATEIVASGVDEDCDRSELCYVDADGDGYGTATAVASSDFSCRSSGKSDAPDDCDDADSAVTCADTADTGDAASIENVFVLFLENQNWSDIFGNTAEAPYINDTLLPMSSYADRYYATPHGVHPSLPNYIYLEAGDTMGITTNDDPGPTQKVTSTDHLVSQLDGAGIDWQSWQEDAPGGCPIAADGYYAPKHNPFVYFTDIAEDPPSATARVCSEHVHPYSELAPALAAGLTGYHFITPNLCNDMHDLCSGTSKIRNGDDFLSVVVPEIMASSAWERGVIFITFDESEGGEYPVMMLVLSPFAKGGGYSNTTYYTHGSLLRTIEDIYEVPYLRDANYSEDLWDLFDVHP